MSKRAVVVGVNDYSILDPSGNSNLSQCVRDANSMYYLLKDAFNFNDIYFYKNLNASRNNILTTLGHLISISEAGDSVCFYFSGHGSRIRADLTLADCNMYYEALVPASGSWITDKDLSQLADRLDPGHVNFTVITDACNSGGLHPADASLKCRTPSYSNELIQAIVDFLTTLIPCGMCLPLNSTELNNNISNVQAAGNGTIDLDTDSDKTLIAATKSTLLSACRYDELSWESTRYRHGLFTQAILDMVNQSNFQASYHAMLEQLRTNVENKITESILPHHPGTTQTPQLFGQRNRMGENFLEGWIDSPLNP